jgi:hypothetical protein
MKASTFLLAVGFLLIFGAVGGMENDGPLLEGIGIAFVGLAIAYCGVLFLRAENE